MPGNVTAEQNMETTGEEKRHCRENCTVRLKNCRASFQPVYTAVILVLVESPFTYVWNLRSSSGSALLFLFGVEMSEISVTFGRLWSLWRRKITFHYEIYFFDFDRPWMVSTFPFWKKSVACLLLRFHNNPMEDVLPLISLFSYKFVCGANACGF